MKKAILSTAVLFVMFLSVFAQEPKDTMRVYKNRPIKVLADKLNIAKEDTVKTDNTISNSVLEQAQKLSPAMFFTRRALMGYGVASGAAGKINLFGLGGSPTSQVLFLQDGDPLFMGLMGHPVFDAFNIMGMGKIELVEGASPVEFGTGAMGGAINLKTQRLTDKGLDIGVQSRYGAYGSMNNGVKILGKISDIDWGANYSAEHTDGYRDDANDSYSSQRFGAHIGYISDKNNILLSANNDWFGVFDPGTKESPNDSSWYRIKRSHFHIHWRHLFGKLSTEMGAFQHIGRHTIYDGYRGDDISWGTKVSAIYNLSFGEIGLKFSSLQMGGDAKNISTGIDFGSNWATEYRTAIWDDAKFGRVNLRIGTAIFGRKSFKSHISPELYLSYDLLKYGDIFGKIANGFRFPSLRETSVFPWSNANLEPEDSWTGELGFKLRTSKLTGQISVWHTYARNLIIYGYPGKPFANSGDFDRNGFDTNIKYNPFKSFSLNVGFAYQDLNERKSISPGYHLTYSLDFQKKLIFPFKISLSGEGAKDLYASDSDDDKLPDYLVGNLRLEIEPIKYFKLIASVENITDAKYYTQKGYPMPPRTIWCGISADWKTEYK